MHDEMVARGHRIAGPALALHGATGLAVGFAVAARSSSWIAAPGIDLVLGVALIFAAQSLRQPFRWAALGWTTLKMVLVIATSHESALDAMLVFVFYGGVAALLRLWHTRVAAAVVLVTLGVSIAAAAVVWATALPDGMLTGHQYPWRLHVPRRWRKPNLFGPVGNADGAAVRPDVQATVRVMATSIANGNFSLPADIAEQIPKDGSGTFSIASTKSSANADVYHVRSSDAECLVSLVAATPTVYEVRACAPPAAYPSVEAELRGIVQSFEVR